MDTTIRRATQSDAGPLSALGRQTFTATFGHLYAPQDLEAHLQACRSPESFLRYIEHDVVLVAETGGELSGYIKCGRVALPVTAAPDDREIHHLYVSSRFQGAGIGRRLMEAALVEKEISAAPAIYLGVWEENDRALRFYRSYGFEKVGEYTYYVGKHADNEFILCRPSASK